MDEQRPAEKATDTEIIGMRASSWLVIGGGAMLALGLVGAVVMLSEMSGDDYDTIDRWIAGLTGLLVAGMGLAVQGIALILRRLED